MTKDEMDELDIWLWVYLMGMKASQLKTVAEYVFPWFPTRNDAQAIECAEKTKLPYHINKLGPDSYFCEVGNSKSFAYESTLSLAVSLACKKAWGGK